MIIAASAHLTEQYSVIIELLNTEVFSTTAWNVEMFDAELPSEVDLAFVMDQSGSGTLSEDGKTLTIFIEVCPYNDFYVTVGGFKKSFNLSEGKFEIASTLIAANKIKWKYDEQRDPNWTGIAPMGFVYFNSKKNPAPKGGSITGQLVQGDQLKAYVIGTSFQYIINTDIPWLDEWPFGGIIFTQFIWTGEIPTTAQQYRLQFQAGNRGSALSNAEYTVTLDNKTAISPTSAVYKLLPNHEFRLDGTLR